jgi:hypothetical protein
MNTRQKIKLWWIHRQVDEMIRQDNLRLLDEITGGEL